MEEQQGQRGVRSRGCKVRRETDRWPVGSGRSQIDGE